MKLVERRMHQRAAISRGDLHLLVGLLDGLQAEHVAHEPPVRTTDPRLQARRRDRAVAQWVDAEPAEIAVVLGEQRQCTSGDHRDAQPQRLQRAHDRMLGHRLT